LSHFWLEYFKSLLIFFTDFFANLGITKSKLKIVDNIVNNYKAMPDFNETLLLFLIKPTTMNSRDTYLQSIRPIISSALVTENMSEDERFQNKTLRPIIKLQNDLFLAVFKNYIKKYKNVFYNLSLENKMIYIDNAVQKNIKFRNSLKGMVIGQFTTNEYETYVQNSSALNKRIMNIILERLKDQVQLFEKIENLIAV